MKAITRVEYIMTEIKSRMASRKLTRGAKLPSIRRFAAKMQVSKSTVVEAYERLAAEGLISSRPGSGFYVSGSTPPLDVTEIAPQLDRSIDPFWVSRQSLDASDEYLKPGCGWLPSSWMPHDALRGAMRAVARAKQSSLTDYGASLGFAPLRQFLAQHFERYHVEVSPDQILVTDSGTQAIDFLCRLFLEPDDTVLVDDPCYFNFNALLKVHRVKVVTVPYTPNGPDLSEFSALLLEHKPRLYITNGSVHNPTGATLSPSVAHRVLKLAEAANLTIIEDDIFADFAQEPVTRLAAFDDFERVIYVGSFTKTISAAARSGFIAARPDWIEGLINLKIATSFGGNAMNAEIVWHVLKSGAYRKHMLALRERLSELRFEVQSKLNLLGITPWVEPKGGLFLWCSLPDGFDSAELAQQALARKIVLAPGNVFSGRLTASRYMRFNVAQCHSPLIYAALEELLKK